MRSSRSGEEEKAEYRRSMTRPNRQISLACRGRGSVTSQLTKRPFQNTGMSGTKVPPYLFFLSSFSGSGVPVWKSGGLWLSQWLSYLVAPPRTSCMYSLVHPSCIYISRSTSHRHPVSSLCMPIAPRSPPMAPSSPPPRHTASGSPGSCPATSAFMPSRISLLAYSKYLVL